MSPLRLFVRGCWSWLGMFMLSSAAFAQATSSSPPVYTANLDIQPSALRPGEAIRGTLTLTVKGLTPPRDVKVIAELVEIAKPDVIDMGGAELYVKNGRQEKILKNLQDGTRTFAVATDFPLQMPASGDNFALKIYVSDGFNSFSSHVCGALLRLAQSPKRFVLKKAELSPSGQRKLGDAIEFKLSYQAEGIPAPPAAAAVVGQNVEFEHQRLTSDKKPIWSSADGGKTLQELSDPSGAKLVETTYRFTIQEAVPHQITYEIASPGFAPLQGQLPIDVAPPPQATPAVALTGAPLELTDFDQRAVATLRALYSGQAVDPKSVTKEQAQSLTRWDKYTKPDGGKAQVYALNFGAITGARNNSGVYKLTVGEPLSDAKDWTSLAKAPMEGSTAEVLYRQVTLSASEQYINAGVRIKIGGVILSITQRRPNDPAKEPKEGGEYLLGRLKEFITLARQNALFGGQLKFTFLSDNNSTPLGDERLWFSLGEKEIQRTVRIEYQGPRDTPGAQPKKLIVQLRGAYAPTVAWGVGPDKVKGDQKLTVDLAKRPFPVDVTLVLPSDESPAVRAVVYEQLRQTKTPAGGAPGLSVKASVAME